MQHTMRRTMRRHLSATPRFLESTNSSVALSYNGSSLLTRKRKSLNHQKTSLERTPMTTSQSQERGDPTLLKLYSINWRMR